MRVAVVGTLKTQERELTLRTYPNLRLQFASKGHRSRSDDQWIANSDRIIIMSKHVGHGVMQKLDKKKTIFINGGLQQAQEALINLNDSVFAEESVSARASLKEREQNHVAKGDESMAYDEATDFKTAFMTAKEGDVLVFKRPRTITQKTWEGRVGVARSYYKRLKGIITSAPEWKDGTATMLIEKTPEAKPENHKPVITPREAAEMADENLNPLVDVVATPPAPPKTSTVTQLFRDQETTQPMPTTEAPAAVPVAAADRQFWKEVYLQSMRNSPGSPAAFHSQTADLAYDLLVTKMGG